MFVEGVNINNDVTSRRFNQGYGRFEEQFLFARQYGSRYNIVLIGTTKPLSNAFKTNRPNDVSKADTWRLTVDILRALAAANKNQQLYMIILIHK